VRRSRAGRCILGGMHGVGARDGNRIVDWSKASEGYAEFRSGPPASWYRALASHGIGVAGQRLLDLGTGTGFVAAHMARAGLEVAGVDPALGQLERARESAKREGLTIDYRHAQAYDQKH